jgi:hypothetical protein
MQVKLGSRSAQNRVQQHGIGGCITSAFWGAKTKANSIALNPGHIPAGHVDFASSSLETLIASSFPQPRNGHPKF